MTEIFEEIYSFLSKIGVPVYPENGVPVDAVFPYLSWTPTQTNWDINGIMPIRIWDRGSNYKRLAEIADKLSSEIGEGVILTANFGYICLYRGDPWVQAQPLQETDVKVLYVNLGISTMIQ